MEGGTHRRDERLLLLQEHWVDDRLVDADACVDERKVGVVAEASAEAEAAAAAAAGEVEARDDRC